MTALGVIATMPQAHATLLAPGGTAVPVAEPLNPLSATIVANTGVQNYSVSSGGDSMTGTGQAWVVTNYANNPFGAGDLTFVYQVSLTGGTASGSPAIVERLSMSSFGSFLTDVGYFAQSGTQKIPPNATRSSNGSVVGFDYTTNVINIGDKTTLLIVNTNATLFTSGTLTVQDGLTANLNGYSPTAVPEPATIAMAFAGLPVLGLFWARRRKARTA